MVLLSVFVTNLCDAPLPGDSQDKIVGLPQVVRDIFLSLDLPY